MLTDDHKGGCVLYEKRKQVEVLLADESVKEAYLGKKKA